MTTITNYLCGNFTSKDSHQIERPIAVLEGSNYILQSLWNCSINKNLNSNRQMVIVDFGLSWIRRLITLPIQNKIIKKQIEINNLNKNQILIRSSALVIKAEGYLQNVFCVLKELIKESQFKNILLLIEGIECLQLFHSEKIITAFIISLNNLPAEYKQINLLMPTKLVNRSIQFIVEKLSTCIIEIKDKHTENLWNIYMTVRRYTGFSNQESYVVEIKDQSNFKIEKKKHVIQDDKEEVEGLGFDFKKSNKLKEQEKELKKIIYPYLNVQSESGCSNCQCETEHQGNCHEQIILDDEEQQDIDV